MKITHLLLDVDGVLLDWSGGFLRYMEVRGHPPRSVTHRRWDMRCCFPTLDGQQIWNFINMFHHSEAYGELEPLPGAVSAARFLRMKLPNTKFVAITACGLDPRTIHLRTQALQQFPIDEVHFVSPRQGKGEILAKFPADTSIMVEDKPENIDDVLDLGMRAIMIDHEYNQHYEPESGKFFRALGWGYAKDYILLLAGSEAICHAA